MNAQELVRWGGVALILLLVFAETGLLLGLIIPGGETLVFTAGILASTDAIDISVGALLGLLVAAGAIGDASGYLIGRRHGRKLYNKKDRWYFKKKYLHLAEGFFQRHKRSSVFFGKFLPVIRPFTPVFAGMSGQPFHFFYPLTLAAGAVYMSAFLLAGYYLSARFPFIQENLHWILPISIILALVPVFVELRKEKKRSPSGGDPSGAEPS